MTDLDKFINSMFESKKVKAEKYFNSILTQRIAEKYSNVKDEVAKTLFKE